MMMTEGGNSEGKGAVCLLSGSRLCELQDAGSWQKVEQGQNHLHKHFRRYGVLLSGWLEWLTAAPSGEQQHVQMLKTLFGPLVYCVIAVRRIMLRWKVPLAVLITDLAGK